MPDQPTTYHRLCLPLSSDSFHGQTLYGIPRRRRAYRLQQPPTHTSSPAYLISVTDRLETRESRTECEWPPIPRCWCDRGWGLWVIIRYQGVPIRPKSSHPARSQQHRTAPQRSHGSSESEKGIGSRKVWSWFLGPGPGPSASRYCYYYCYQPTTAAAAVS